MCCILVCLRLWSLQLVVCVVLTPPLVHTATYSLMPPGLSYGHGQALLALHFTLVVLFQLLGTVRAGQSWLQALRKEKKDASKKAAAKAKMRAKKEAAKTNPVKKDARAAAPAAALAITAGASAPPANNTGASEPTAESPSSPLLASLLALLAPVAVAASAVARRAEVLPAPSFGNVDASLALLLEFVQLCSFSFQAPPMTDEEHHFRAATDDGDDGGGDDDVLASLVNATKAVGFAPKWLSDLHGVTYGADFSPLDSLGFCEWRIARTRKATRKRFSPVRDPHHSSIRAPCRTCGSAAVPEMPPLAPCWAAVGAVCVLVGLFVFQFLVELRTYGLYLTHGSKGTGTGPHAANGDKVSQRCLGSLLHASPPLSLSLPSVCVSINLLNFPFFLRASPRFPVVLCRRRATTSSRRSRVRWCTVTATPSGWAAPRASSSRCSPTRSLWPSPFSSRGR